MRIALTTESNPQDADLEKVLPGVNQRLNASHSLLVGMQHQFEHKFEQLTETVKCGFTQVTSLTENWKEETDKLVGCSLVQAGTNLLRQSSPMSPGSEGAASLDDDMAISPALAISPARQNRTTPTVTTTATNSNQEHSRYRMQLKHATLHSVWKEWFGLDEFADEFGGINGRNKLHGSKWRKHLNGTTLSKVSQLIKGINAYAVERKVQPEDVIEEWEGIFTASKNSVCNMVKALQHLGKMKKLKQRGKHIPINK
jgi:hypothetical protein